MNKNLNIQFEKAIRLMCEVFPPADETTRKPVLAHDIRVGTYLYNNNYSENTVIAGLLHDTLEWSNINEETLKEKFGEEIVELIKANSKDDSIKDPKEKRRDLMTRCAGHSKEALIIKAADTIDSFIFYTKNNNQEQLENHCIPTAKAILEYKPKEYKDPIFDKLKTYL